MQPQERALPYEIPFRPWEVVSPNVFMVDNKMLLCIVDYYSKFATVKKVGSLAADDLVQTAKMIFAEYGLPKKSISDKGTRYKFSHERHLESFVGR